MNKQKKTILLWLGFIIAYFVFLYFFNSTLEYNRPKDFQAGIVYEKGRVTEIVWEELDPDPDVPSISKIGRAHV